MVETTSAGAEPIKDTKHKLNPKEIVFKYLVYLPLFILCLGISIGIAYIYLRYKIPFYNSSIALLIKDDKNSRGNTDALDEIALFKSKSNLANEIEILKSATLMEKVVRVTGLNTSYLVEGNLKRTEVYGYRPFNYEPVALKDSNSAYNVVLTFNDKRNFKVEGLGEKWYQSGEIVHGKQGDFRINLNSGSTFNPQYKYIVQYQTPFQAASSIAGGLAIRQLNREASILKINFISEIPQKGRDILNELVKAYNSTTIENKNKVVDNTVKFIDDRLILLTSELGKVEQGLEDFKQRNELVNIETQSQGQFDVMKTTNEKLNEQEIRLQVINMINNYISNPGKKYSLVPSSLGLDDPTLLALVGTYNQMQLEREEKLKTMPEANPVMQVMENQIEKVRVSILENLSNIKRSTEILRTKFYADYNSLKGQIRTVPSKERELLEIARQQGIKEKLYLFLLQKREESAITIAASTSNAAAVDPATTIWAPVSPDRSGTIRMALIIGLLIPAAFIYLKELLNDKVTNRSDITKITQMPIVGEIAHNKMADREVVIGAKDRSIIAEQFRVSRTNLQYFITDKKSPVILVTSSMAAEGKTFTSMNLGAVWAVANKKTVILELDLRKPKISKALGLLDKKGISNYIVGDAVKEELPVLVTNTTNLYIVPAGPIPPNPSELLLDEKIEILFNYLKETFDFIIIDSAPLGLVSDAKVLSRYADCTVYVVRQRYTPKKQIDYINDLYVRKTFSNIGLLINDVKLTGANSYYGYGYGGYGYGYGYGYGFNYNMPYGYTENENKPNVFKKLLGFFR
ncbi:MAG: polysaccharide biosynthesis tyrosine autokinase [Segetibacter sp.]|nr:polysaccharide biosynthesis tyrosine autokinase [Segetibacter sp.]